MRDEDTLVYLGTIDDVLLRHPWRDIAIGENFLVDTIVDHVIFGEPMLINDGYLINHPLARADLMKGKDSLILKLVEKGFIKILTRVSNPDELSKMPEQMARQNIKDFPDRLRSDDWEKLKYALDRLSDSLKFHYNCYRWPAVDMGDGFRILVENTIEGAYSKGFDSLGLNIRYGDHTLRTLNRIAERLAKNTSGARSYFEDAVKEAAKTLPGSDAETFVSELMGLANEIYHFNFGIHLDSKYRKDGLAIIAETRLSRAFDDMLAVDERVLEIDGELPLVGKPNLIKELSPSLLAGVVDPSTRVGDAKRSFKRLMREFAKGKYTMEEAQGFAAQYERALSEHFATSRSTVVSARVINVGMTISAAVLGAGVPLASTGMAAMAEAALYSTGLGLLASQVGEPGIMKVAKRFYNRRLREQFASSRVRLEPHVTRAMLSSLRFQPEIVDSVATRVKRLD